MKKIAITLGDPSGIGSEVVLKALEGVKNPDNFVILSSKKILAKAQADFAIALDENIEIIDEFENINFEYGVDSEKTGQYSFGVLKKACELAQEEKIKAIVTAPVSKYALNLAGHNFSGQTEILEKYIAAEGFQAQMLFVNRDFRVLLLTRHIALKDVSEKIDLAKILENVKELNFFLSLHFGIHAPKIALCSLNPHAGENGIIGKEEQLVLNSVSKFSKLMYGVDIDNPKPADTLFVEAAKAFNNNQKQPYDAYIACYHDQGLIPIKMLDFENTVNMTIGLEVVRTSPSHGTAFDIAGKNIANFKSMKQAILLAEKTT